MLWPISPTALCSHSKAKTHMEARKVAQVMYSISVVSQLTERTKNDKSGFREAGIKTSHEVLRNQESYMEDVTLELNLEY